MKNVFLVAFCFLMACQTSNKQEVDLKALKNEVLDIHDDVMPNMGDLRRVRKSLMLRADSIMASDSARAAILLTASDAIDAANEGMMDWMRNFDPNFEGTYEETLNYLNEKKASIEVVRKNMLESKSEGEKVLEAN